MSPRTNGSCSMSVRGLGHGPAFTVLITSLLSWASACAADPVFGGAYDIASVAPMSETQSNVKLRLRVQNVSGEYVANAAISVLDESMPESLGVFVEPLNLDHLGTATLETTVTVARDLAARWLSGAPVGFEAAYVDASGQPQRRQVDAPRMPVGEGM